jgi:ribosomal protein S18 acetylase RimI-like enzyme
MKPGFRVEMLAPQHDRKSFSCGTEVLDTYFRERAGQDVKRRVSNCFVLLDGDGAVAGFYTFAATSLPLTELSEPERKRLPRYPLMPAALIGRLAIDQGFRGQGLGGALVVDAALRAARSDPAIFALIVDAKDEAAAAFYHHLEFIAFESRPQSPYLPVATALSALDL